jgi:hypothetical protein
MKSIIVKTIVTIFSILFLATGSAMFAADKEKTATSEVQSKSAQEVQPAVDAKTDEKVAEQRKKILSEATVAIEESRKALRALDEGKTEEAIKALELATGKMALIIARDHEPSVSEEFSLAELLPEHDQTDAWEELDDLGRNLHFSHVLQ